MSRGMGGSYLLDLVNEISELSELSELSYFSELSELSSFDFIIFVCHMYIDNIYLKSLNIYISIPPDTPNILKTDFPQSRITQTIHIKINKMLIIKSQQQNIHNHNSTNIENPPIVKQHSHNTQHTVVDITEP